MIRILNYVIIIGALVTVALWFTGQPGSVEITWLGWQVDTSVPVVVPVLLILFFLITLPLRFVKSVARVPSAVNETVQETLSDAAEARADRVEEAGYDALTGCITGLAAGDVEKAAENAEKAAETLEDETLVTVLVAQAAEMAGDEETARQQYESLLGAPKTEMIALKGLLRQTREGGEDEKAEEYARRAFGQRPDLPWASLTLFNLQMEREAYESALKTLASIIEHEQIPRARARRLRVTLLVALSDRAAKGGDLPKAELYAQQAMQEDGGFSPAATRAAIYGQKQGKDREAVSSLLKVWRTKPHPDVFKAYLKLFPDENEYMLVQRAEQLAAVNRKHPENHLMVAEAALKAGLWGQARKELDLFQTKRETTQKTARMIAEFEEGGNADTAEALKWFRKSEECRPDATWICSSCGVHLEEWTSRCPHCGAFASAIWTEQEGALTEERGAYMEAEKKASL